MLGDDLMIFGDLFKLVNLINGRLIIKKIHDFITKIHDFFEGFDELREIIIKVGFLFMICY